MKSAEHPFTPEDVQAWVDGEFGGERADAIQTHVAACTSCRDLVETIRSVSTAMAQWPPEKAPALTAPVIPNGVVPRPWWIRPTQAAAVVVAAGLCWWLVTVPFAPRPREMAESLEPVAVHWVVESDGTRRKLAPSEVQQLARQPQDLPSSASKGVRSALMMRSGNTQPDVPPASSRPAMVVRTATLTLLVTDIEKARASLDSLVSRVGGFVGQMDTSGGRGEARWLTTTLRVPEQRLAEAVAILKTLGSVQSESQGGEDVTSQATDLDARLANARETEKRLVTVLQQRTGKVADVLEVEREIARVRESIELMMSQREQLRDRVTYATISLRVTEETKASLDLGTPSIPGRFRNALVEGTSAATEAVLTMTLFLVRVAPSAILLMVVLGWPAVMVLRRARATR